MADRIDTGPPSNGSSEAGRSVADWLALIDESDREGEFLESYDLASRALTHHRDEVSLRYRAVLSLARSGATDRARQLFREYGLNQRPEEDMAALGARLAKDYALAANPRDRAVHASVAAALYEDTFQRTGGYYPAINAATMWLVAGAEDRAKSLAAAVLDLCKRVSGGTALETYYLEATRAEAALLLDDLDAARAALERATSSGARDSAALVGTRRQLGLICDIRGLDRILLEPLRVADVVHYTGHMIGRLVPQYEELISRRIAQYLGTRRIGFAYGSLASGADILVAEALLERDVELRVILPCDEERFIAMSVATGGPEWVRRFLRCRARARSVTYASTDTPPANEEALSYASSVAIGLAITRARHLGAKVEQVAVWDGRSTIDPRAGTQADMGIWRRTGLPTHVIECPPAPSSRTSSASSLSEGGAPRQSVRAFLFCDVKGFSGLREHQIPKFVEGVMGVLATVLERYGDEILARNTWGDGLFLVFREVVNAARCALDLHAALAERRLDAHGLPPGLALRIGGHAGPVFEMADPVLGQPGFFGSHVTRTARIEPVTPESETYVTEQFAALLGLVPDTRLRCEYVGHLPTAKSFGALRMYVLKQDEVG